MVACGCRVRIMYSYLCLSSFVICNLYQVLLTFDYEPLRDDV